MTKKMGQKGGNRPQIALEQKGEKSRPKAGSARADGEPAKFAGGRIGSKTQGV